MKKKISLGPHRYKCQNNIKPLNMKRRLLYLKTQFVTRSKHFSSRYSNSLRAGRSEDRIPVGPRFSAPVQTGPGAHPASCTMGTGSFPGAKRSGRGSDHLPPSKRRGHERVQLCLYSTSGAQWPVTGRTLPLPLRREKKFMWPIIPQRKDTN